MSTTSRSNAGRASLSVWGTALAAGLASAALATPPQCNSVAGSCYLVHPTGGCDDVACCTTICDLDPFCCGVTWDNPCVYEASDFCAPDFLIDDVPNPANGHRYTFTRPMESTQAAALLANYGYSQTSISSSLENNWLRLNLASNVPGLPAFSPRIGLSRPSDGGAFTWANGDAVTFTNWAPNEPSSDLSLTNVHLLGASGRWKAALSTNAICTIGDWSFPMCGGGAGDCSSAHPLPGCNDESCCNEICHIDVFCCLHEWDSVCAGEAESLCAAAVTGPTLVQTSTGHRYVTVSGASWLQAERLANELGGHLVSISSEAENTWIVENFLSQAGSPDQLSIGLNDFAVENAFRWSDHEPVTFTNWAAGEPNNDLNNEDVTTLRSNGTWNDMPNSYWAFALIELPCTGDLDGDATIGGADLAVLLGAWGGASTVADLNADGIIDGADLAVLLGAWGHCPVSNACVPHDFPGSDQPGCTACVCDVDPYCCTAQWDSGCRLEASEECNFACQCGG